MIFDDRLLRASVVVEHDGALWLVPRRPGGWANRLRLNLTPAAQSERLRPAKDIKPAWLGVPAETERTECDRISAGGAT